MIRRNSEERFDYVVVGAGTAGCLLVDRLSADPKVSVCVIEAGPSDNHPYIHLPAGYIKTLYNPKYTWRFKTEPSTGSGGRSIAATQGKTLGGSSSINGLVYNRGQAADYDHWAQLGNSGWSYDEVLPYFKRGEKRIGSGDERYHGRDGSLPVTDIDWHHPLCDDFVLGAQSLGIPRNPDYNGASQEGVGYYQRVISNGARWSSAKSYLKTALNRPNVRLVTKAQVSRIMFDRKRATAVEYFQTGGVTGTVHAAREVVVAAGAINSPKLLQLSGIGPMRLLQSLGIPVLHALEGVGENLRDHWAVRTVARVTGIGTINRMVTGIPLLKEAARWALGKPSVLSVSPSLVHVFWKSDDALSSPDLQLTFTPASYREGVAGLLDKYDGMTCGVWQQRPESTGYVRVISKVPQDDPLVQPNYLASETDQRTIVGGIRLAQSLLASEPLSRHFGGHVSPADDRSSDAEMLDFARNNGSTVFHLIGSCRMGPDEDARSVVDNQLRVKGVTGLRVIDASIMPTMPSANTMAATYMIAEKGADMIISQNR